MHLISRPPRFTAADYFKIEYASIERHEFIDGEIYLKPSESGEHSDITSNIVAIIGYHLRGKPCRARTKDTKVRSGPGLQAQFNVKGMYSYPDIVVVCREPEYDVENTNVLLNPKVIFEVLSNSTEAFDRGEKFDRYQSWNPTLTEYLLVSQDRPRIEHFTRQDDDTWTYKRVFGLDEVVVIASIDCSLKLVDVYDRIEFPKPKRARATRKRSEK